MELESIIGWNTYFSAVTGKKKKQFDDGKPDKRAFYAKYGNKIKRKNKKDK